MTIEETGIKPAVISQIREIASRRGVEKVVLYGSRARGDHGKKSDIDLAVRGGDTARFALDVEEDTDTLLMYDITDLGDDLRKEFLDEIMRDGIVLYEKV